MEDNDVLVLVDAAERPEDIDAIRARRKADEAREILLQKEEPSGVPHRAGHLGPVPEPRRVKEHR